MKLEMMHDLIDGAAAAADYTGLTRRTIYRLTDQGRLPAVRMGRRLYFRKSELDRAFTAISDPANETLPINTAA